MQQRAVEFDELSIRCPMLGHPVPFSYCRQPGGALPCRKIAECWSGRIDIQGFLSSNFSEEELSRITAPPKPKLFQIIELARAARDRSGQ
ncbi:MAG: hypothetical protein WDA72_08320 [Desulfomonilia bacterium]|jgi:hypothetical protein|nr:hypothetical protein [Desulfomonilia bacterium]HPX19275.1 hypothetical protein [Deltaproteobacteria bacterium]